MPNSSDDTGSNTTGPTTEQMFAAAMEMSGPEWFAFTQAVGKERNRVWAIRREQEADRLAEMLDMTAEGYVREWDRRGRSRIFRLSRGSPPTIERA